MRNFETTKQVLVQIIYLFVGILGLESNWVNSALCALIMEKGARGGVVR
jgi:hypothetical protein